MSMNDLLNDWLVDSGRTRFDGQDMKNFASYVQARVIKAIENSAILPSNTLAVLERLKREL